jgi:hypothetical protein
MKRTTILGICITALVAFVAWAPNANATSSLFTSQCDGCHGSTSGVAPYLDNTCAGCHAHGVHPDSDKNTMNVSATPDFTTYAPGDSIIVQVTGGYRDGWVRAQMWDLDCNTASTCNQGNVLAEESLYTSDSEVSFPGPVALTSTVPVTPGVYTWYAGWYGNEYDITNAAFGLWIPDSNNGGHGNELVAFTFTVTDGATTTTTTLAPTTTTTTLAPTTTTTTLAPNTTTTTLAPTTTTTTLAPTTTTTTLAPTTTTTSTTTTTLPGNDKVTICHIPPGRSAKAHTLSVNVMAVPAHLRHGDTLGPCP